MLLIVLEVYNSFDRSYDSLSISFRDRSISNQRLGVG